jgi:predicted amidophosphoribosyltransferase
VLAAAVPHPVAPTPAPVGLPPCRALDAYDGVLRQLILAYKERERHDLARSLGRLLAAVVSTAVSPGPVVLVPVPDTGRAARQRYGDHLARLASHAARALRRAGWPVAVSPALRALPRLDSTALDSGARARAAADAFRVRSAALAGLRRAVASGGRVVVLDDIVTTGVTLTAVSRQLAAVGVTVEAAAVLAATRRR